MGFLWEKIINESEAHSSRDSCQHLEIVKIITQIPTASNNACDITLPMLCAILYTIFHPKIFVYFT